VNGFIEGVAAHGFYDAVARLFGRALNPLKIDEPSPGDTLKEPLEFEKGLTCYRVTGTLRHLPKNHKIWLLEQLPSSAQVKPQAFQQGRVTFKNGRWEGRVYPSMAYGNRTTIIAVVAPPGVDMLFNYYQRHCQQTNWAPIDHVPIDGWNKDTVQATVP
jgi:hypothetical protein